MCDAFPKDASGIACIPVMKAVINNDIITVSELIADEPSIVNFVYKKSHDSVLLIAARYRRVEILQLLIDHGADVEHRNVNLKRALHEASGSGCVQCVRHLLRRGRANVDALKHADWTPLMIACTKGHLDVIEELVASGADVTRVNKDGWNCFHLACRESNEAVLKYLTTIDGNLWRQKSKNGRTPLHTACMHGRYEVVEYLLKCFSYPKDEKDSCGSTPLIDSIRFGHVEVAKLLISQNKCDVMESDNLGRHIIHIAAHSGQLDSLKYVVDQLQLDVNLYCVGSASKPLHFASKEGHVDCVAYLLQRGGRVNDVDSNGRTALHLSAAANKVDVVRLLVDVYHADRSVVDVKGITAFHYAMTDAVRGCFIVEE